MHVLFLFGFLTFVFELLLLPHVKSRFLRCLPLAGMELFPLAGIVYNMIKRPGGFLWGWEENSIFCLWIAGAVLLGWILARILYQRAEKRKR